MAVLLSRRLYRLVRDYRNHVPGSRLTVRTVAVFSGLVIVPLLIIYGFALHFLNKSIDSWFNGEMRQDLSDAVNQSRAALELRTSEEGRVIADVAAQLAREPDADLGVALNDRRRESGASEMLVFDADGTVAATSHAAGQPLPVPGVPREVLAKVQGGESYGGFDPTTDGGFLITVATPIPYARRTPPRFLLARAELPRELAGVANAVQDIRNSFANLQESRKPLKYSFRLTLTLVLLLAMFAAMFLAIRSRASPDASGTRPHRGHARGRQGRLHHAPAIARTRRDGLAGALLQRHDPAPAPYQRGSQPQPRAGGRRTRTPRGDPRRPFHRRDGARHRAPPAPRQCRGGCHPRRAAGAGHRPRAARVA